MVTMIWPTGSTEQPPLGDLFGPRNYGDGFHDGVDILKGNGYQWVSPMDGEVIFSGWSGMKFGYHAVVRATILGKQVDALVAHCQAGSTPGLGPIRQGSPIGRCGLTGDTRGYHGHYEVCVNGDWRYDLGAVDPIAFMADVNTATTSLPTLPLNETEEQDMYFFKHDSHEIWYLIGLGQRTVRVRSQREAALIRDAITPGKNAPRRSSDELTALITACESLIDPTLDPVALASMIADQIRDDLATTPASGD